MKPELRAVSKGKSAFAWKVFAELSESEYWFCSFGSWGAEVKPEGLL